MSDEIELTTELQAHFGTSIGAGSVINSGDGGPKGQISLKRRFVKPLVKRLVPNIKKGNADSLGDSARKDFRIWPSGEVVSLQLVIRPDSPNQKRDEHRLYMNKGDGKFRPGSGDYWFILDKGGAPWLASLSKSEMQQIHGPSKFDPQNGFDQCNEDDYQDRLNDRKPRRRTSKSSGWVRDPDVASRALLKSEYICEMLPDAPCFTSKTTKKPYLEAHHFYPMSEQGNVKKEHNLDVVENICILNPYAHKMVHHATYSEIEGHLKKMAEPREDFLKDIGVSVDRVLRCYGGP